MTGNYLAIRSKDAEIHGTFNASTVIDLETSNAHIVANVSLVSSATNANPNAAPTRLLFKTSNGYALCLL